MRIWTFLRNKRINPATMGPSKTRMNIAKDTLKYLKDNQQWFCGGYRSAAIAAELLRNGKIVALPTDTIYGLAGLAQDDKAIARLYEIKKRDANKPLAICLCDVEDIEKWAHIEDLPDGLTASLLPGPTTLILRRKGTLNPLLNPGVRKVGIRIPKFDFVRSVVKMLNEPIALTSANESGQRNTLHPSEFKSLWPRLDGVFYEQMGTGTLRDSWRAGSTIVDLSVKGEYEILRRGIGHLKTLQTLKCFNLKKRPKKKKDEKKEETKNSEDSESSEEIEAHASG